LGTATQFIPGIIALLTGVLLIEKHRKVVDRLLTSHLGFWTGRLKWPKRPGNKEFFFARTFIILLGILLIFVGHVLIYEFIMSHFYGTQS